MQVLAERCAILLLLSAGFGGCACLLVNQAAAEVSRPGLIWAADSDEGPSDPGTRQGDAAEPGTPDVMPPSEDDTQQEASPSLPEIGPPDSGGCIFDKRDFGLTI